MPCRCSRVRVCRWGALPGRGGCVAAGPTVGTGWCSGLRLSIERKFTVTRRVSSDLAVIGGAEELHIATCRVDGSLRTWLPIWVVRIGDDLYVRSARGREGSWFRHALRTRPSPSPSSRPPRATEPWTNATPSRHCSNPDPRPPHRYPARYRRSGRCLPVAGEALGEVLSGVVPPITTADRDSLSPRGSG